MYIIKKGTSYKTDGGWTSIHGNYLIGLDNVLRFTKGESERLTLPKGQSFVHFPLRKWEYLP